MNDSVPDRTNAPPPELFTRERSMAVALVVATGIAFYLCYLVMQPFFPALAWALALAVIVSPVHRRVRATISNRNIAAGLTTALAVLVIGAPVVFVTQNLAKEATRSARSIQESFESGEWREIFDRWPRLKPVVPWIESQLSLSPQTSSDPEQESSDSSAEATENPAQPKGLHLDSVQQVVSVLGPRLGGLVETTGWVALQFFVTLMSLFFFLRDRPAVMHELRSLLPLSNGEAEEVFRRVDDTIHATVFGSVVVAMVQGFMGGLIFWWLGLPSPLLWGTVMGVLAVVPVLGTFVVWAPTAAFLALQGDWTKALVLVAWGSIAIGLIDNLLYPFLVGKRLRFHTLLVFFSIVGGLAAFGASGIILGPVLLAITDALIEIWRRRTRWGGSIESGIQSTPS